MINNVIGGALRYRFLVVVLSLGLVGYGVYSTFKLNVDAFPDVTNVQVVINSEAPGLGPTAASS